MSVNRDSVNDCFVSMPIVSAETNEAVGYEVLLRSFRGIPLDVFNRNPELFCTLARSILLEIARLTSRYANSTKKKTLVYINFTVGQLLSPGMLECINCMVADQWDMKNLVIELTEGDLQSDVTLVKERLSLLRRLGVRLAIDDFGVGASNFQRVFDLNPEIIKLDRMMLEGCCESEGMANKVSALTDYFHSLALEVVAEGVETEVHYNIAKRCGVDYLQGFYFGKPEEIGG